MFVTALQTAFRTAFRTNFEHRPEPEPEPEPVLTVLTSGLWLLVVETLILNIISQRAREMMIKNSEEQP